MNGNMWLEANLCFLEAQYAIEKHTPGSLNMVIYKYLQGLKSLVQGASSQSLSDPRLWLRTDDSEFFMKMLSTVSEELLSYRKSYIEYYEKNNRKCKKGGAK